MCTAATYQTKDFYFGRTLDYAFLLWRGSHHNARASIRLPSASRTAWESMDRSLCYDWHGTCDRRDIPLYYDAVNEKGLGMAGLNFVGNADYKEPMRRARTTWRSLKLLPWILGQCATVKQDARALLEKLQSRQYPL